MSPSLNSSGVLDRSKSWHPSSMSCLLARTYSQPSLRCICSKAQVVSAMMCQGSSIPHSWRKREYSRATLRVRSAYSLTKIPLPASSSSDICFWLLSLKGRGHHVQRECAPEESLLFFQHVISNVTAYTIFSGSSRSTEKQVVVAVLQQYVGSVPEVDDTGLVVGERNIELLIVELLDARFPFVQLCRKLLIYVHLDQGLPCLLHRLYVGQILHRWVLLLDRGFCSSSRSDDKVRCPESGPPFWLERARLRERSGCGHPESRPGEEKRMPKLEVEGVGTFDVEGGKRL